MAAYILHRCLTPGDELHQPGKEYILLAQSLEGAKLVFRPLRDSLPDDGSYRFSESTTRMGIYHKPTRTSLRVISSKGKSALGLGAINPIVVADEPGAWEVNSIMHDALDTALGKPDSDTKIIYIGTLAPEGVEGHWWHEMVTKGTTKDTFVYFITGDLDKWDQANEIRRCNPLMWHYPDSRKVLLAERDAAIGDSRLKARFCSYRLNTPSSLDEARMLLEVDDWNRLAAREVPPRSGPFILGVDLGAGRAFSGATALWSNGRIQSVAVAPGIPSLEDQEKRDHVPHGLYRKLYDEGVLRVAEGLRVQPPSELWDMVLSEWGQPALVVADRFRENELRDVIGSTPLETRVTRWSESSADIRSLRKHVKDGPFAVDPHCHHLLIASLAAARVETDTSGNARLVKKGTHNTGRDDVAAALVLAAGAFERYPAAPEDAEERRPVVVG